MGLDMYLRASKYVSGYDFRGEEEVKEYRRLVRMFGMSKFANPETPSVTVEFTVAYWRKANQIHNWFVEFVQGGEDECKPHHVSRDQLKELRDLCQKVLESSELMPGTVFNGELYDAEHPQGIALAEPGQIVADARTAHELLPTQEGFFFGGTDYDEWYVQDLRATVEQIDRALGLGDGWDFRYQSSW
jgi:hypothetical protein